MTPTAKIVKTIGNGSNGFIKVVEAAVDYDGNQARVHIRLAQPIEADTNEALTFELRELGNALIRATEPSSELQRGDR